MCIKLFLCFASPEFSVFVGDLTSEVDDYQLHQFFLKKYPSCKGAKVVTDPYGNSRYARCLCELTRQPIDLSGPSPWLWPCQSQFQWLHYDGDQGSGPPAISWNIVSFSSLISAVMFNYGFLSFQLLFYSLRTENEDREIRGCGVLQLWQIC